MLLQICCPQCSAKTLISYFLAAQGFFAAQGFLAAQGFAAQGFAPFLAFFCVFPLCCFISQGFFAAQGLPFIAQGLPFIAQGLPFIAQGLPFIAQGLPFIAQGLPFMAPFMAQGFSAAYAEEAAIITTTPNIAKNFFISDSPLNAD